MMNTAIGWLSDSFAPKMNAVNRNPWVSGIQTSIMQILPFILVGSLVTIVGVLADFIPAIPGSIWKMSSYSFGLISIFISFLIPFNILEKKKLPKMRFTGGLTGIALFMMIIKPTFGDAGATFNFQAFGAGGMFAAIIVGLAVTAVMVLFGTFSFFKKDTALPGFVAAWFDSMLPIAIVIGVGWTLVFPLDLDLYKLITALFMPIQSVANTLPGFVILIMLYHFLYSLGISTWVLSPVSYSIFYASISANSAALAAGQAPTLIATSETFFSGWIAIGGVGATLPLVVMMLLLGKSKKMKALGRASIVPSILNINEPVVFGAVAWNPILMVPFWLVGLVSSTVTWLVLNGGLVKIPSQVFSMWYCPFGLSTWLVSKDVMSLVLLAVVLLLVTLIYLPFFKVNDAMELKKEQEEAAAQTAA